MTPKSRESNFATYELLKELHGSMAKGMHRENGKQMEPRIYYDPISFFFSFLKWIKNLIVAELLLYSQKQNVPVRETPVHDNYWSELVFLKKIHMVFKMIFVVRIIITIESWAICVYQVIY